MPGSDRCKVCGQPVGASYYRVKGLFACASCADKARYEQPQDSSAAYTRALTFGIGGAIAGLIVYAVVEIVTGLIIGYVSLAVGYIIGKAMKSGSRGLGGRKYQVTAVLLTYAAVSLAAIPVGISQYLKQHQSQPVEMQQQTPGDSTDVTESSPQPATDRQRPSAAKAIGYLLLIGLASPFLELQDPFHGLIGLVILLVGIRIAWQLTRGVETPIDGPFRNQVTA
jgi:hypothetical protein